MQLKIKKSLHINGSTTPPGSKSQTIRGLFLALLSKGESTLENALESDDSNDAIKVCQNLGAIFSPTENGLILKSQGLPIQSHCSEIYTGNSGITTRFVMPLLGLRKNNHEPIILNCGEQMRTRPIHALVAALRQLGMQIEYLNNENVLPVKISGDLQGGSVTVDGTTSQYLSALLLALPCVSHDSEVIVYHLHERPYMEMTLHWLQQQNIQYIHQKKENYDLFKIYGKKHYQAFNTMIASDFSSASYMIAAAVLTEGTVILNDLNINDAQGDKRLIPILQEMGADIEVQSSKVIIKGGKPLNGIKIDANDIPDLLPTLAVIGTKAYGKTEIYNVKQARIKETDRIHSMTEGLTLLGAKIDEYPDGLIIYPSSLSGTKVNGYNDHRTIMALSIAGLIANGETIIEDSEAIRKTFPTFLKVMQSLGANMREENEYSG